MGKELKQRRTAAAYEKRVGLFNDWATHSRYDSFCSWVEVSPGRFELQLIVDDGVPRTPTVASLLEFAFRQAAGDIDKGGRPEYRNGPQYRRVFGKPQGTSQMPEAKRKKHGFGAYSNESMRFTTIEQYLTSIRQWLTEKLKFYPEVANPAMNGHVRDCTKMLERAMGRSRVESHLPATMSVEFVKEVVTRADPISIEEMQMVLYLVKNLIHGTRAHDENLLDWSDSNDVTELVASGHSGITLKYISTKNNKEQADRKKALSCVLGCTGALQFTEGGRINSAALCPAHLFKHLKERIATEMGLAIDDVEGPIFGKYKRICDVPSGSTLRASDNSSVAKEQAKALVCIVTAEEDAAGMRYDGTEPFVVGGKEYWPPMRGLWVEVAGKGYAVRACSNAGEITNRMRAQLHRANANGKTDLLSEAAIARISSKSMRRSMATILARNPEVSEEELVAMGEWGTAEVARLYVERADVFSGRNHSELLFGASAICSESQPSVALSSTSDCAGANGRKPHKSKVLTVAEQQAKDEQMRKCCGPVDAPNPLRRKLVEANVELLSKLISMDHLPTMQVRDMLCALGIHCSKRDVEGWRQPWRRDCKAAAAAAQVACVVLPRGLPPSLPASPPESGSEMEEEGGSGEGGGDGGCDVVLGDGEGGGAEDGGGLSGVKGGSGEGGGGEGGGGEGGGGDSDKGEGEVLSISADDFDDKAFCVLDEEATHVARAAEDEGYILSPGSDIQEMDLRHSNIEVEGHSSEGDGGKGEGGDGKDKGGDGEGGEGGKGEGEGAGAALQTPSSSVKRKALRGSTKDYAIEVDVQLTTPCKFARGEHVSLLSSSDDEQDGVGLAGKGGGRKGSEDEFPNGEGVDGGGEGGGKSKKSLCEIAEIGQTFGIEFPQNAATTSDEVA